MLSSMTTQTGLKNSLMGLEDFKTDNSESNNNSSDSGSGIDDDTSASSTIPGLDETQTVIEKEEIDKEIQETEAIYGLHPRKWSQMNTDQRVKHVRQNFIEDYGPDHKFEDGWRFAKVGKVECVCDTLLIADPTVTCDNCGRTYKATRRTVIMKQDTDNKA